MNIIIQTPTSISYCYLVRKSHFYFATGTLFLIKTNENSVRELQIHINFLAVGVLGYLKSDSNFSVIV